MLLPDDFEITGVVLCDQFKSLDWQARKIKRINAKLPSEILSEIIAKIDSIYK